MLKIRFLKSANKVFKGYGKRVGKVGQQIFAFFLVGLECKNLLKPGENMFKSLERNFFVEKSVKKLC